jgi:beta-galactosidase
MQHFAAPHEGPSDSSAQPLCPRIPHLLYGGDYNPDQWPEEVWLEDVRAMQQAGVNLVSVAIFSWARLEPRPGAYDFGWLDRVLNLLHAQGIWVNLATATASPPPWLAKWHRESLPVTADGVTLWPGARQHYCPSSLAYREAAAALVRQLATHYRDHPALAMWHINNEYGCHVPACYCDASAAAFRVWLQRRYGSLDALNAAWGTAFWSQRYGEWDEIWPPRHAPTFCNPTQQLDFGRFSSDALLELFDMERGILKEITPDVPITTNFMGFFKPLDYWTWARHEDVVSNDSYPDPADPRAPMDAAMTHDLMRSLGGGRPWMLMEQTPSQVNWRAHNVLKRPGQMRLWSMQAVARGADGVLMFQWRAARAGAEKFHGAMVPHGGTADSRVWREVVELGQELRRLDELVGARTLADVAIVFDWENWWGLELDSKPSSSVTLMEQVQSYYQALYALNVAADFVEPGADLSHYKLVLVPNLYMVRGDVADHLERHVARGGVLIMSYFSGIVDERDHILLGGYPAPFRRLLGLRVEEFDPAVPGQSNGLIVPELLDRGAFSCERWSDVIALEGAQAVAIFERDFYAGRPAVTRHHFGQGAAYYLGTRPDDMFLRWLIDRACDEAGVARTAEAPPGVEVVRRVGKAAAYLFVLNHNAHDVQFTLTSPAYDLLGGTDRHGTVVVGPYGVALLREQRGT